MTAISLLAILFAILIILCRIASFIVTPLWLDYFTYSTPTNQSNESWNSTDDNSLQYHSINIVFIVAAQWFMVSIVSGVILLVILLTGRITDVERNYPMRDLLVIGIAQGFSTTFFNYGMSGSRTAPYLQALISNFVIPNQFIVRFIVLRKWPSKVKLACAVIIVLSEIVSLIPEIFPQLENSADHQRDEGDAGIGGVLWPMCLVASQIPYALANSLIEKNVQSKNGGPDATTSNQGEVNLVFIIFFYGFFNLLTICSLFWLDILPNFGMSSDIKSFVETFWFSTKCFVGCADGCGAIVVVLGWTNVLSNALAAFIIPTLMRFSEGANFLVIVLALRTPIVFIFWTLFQEHPFYWNPRAQLSTWLSIGAILIMIPAIVVYQISAPERTRQKIRITVSVNGDERGLLNDGDKLRSEEEEDDDILNSSRKNIHS